MAEIIATNAARQAATSPSIRRRLNPTVLALWTLVFFHSVTSVLWLALDQRLVNWDPSRHLRNSLGAWQVLSQPGLDMLRRLSDATDVYEPPFAYLVTQPLYLVLGKTADVAVLTNIIFLAILIFATYGIGKLLYNKWAGLLAAFMVSFYPLVAAYTRIYYTDLGLAALVAANLYFLLRNDGFLDRRNSLFFALTLAAGLLTKKAFVFFAIGPSVLVALQAMFRLQHMGEPARLRLTLQPQLPRRMANMVGAVLLAVLLALPWYLDHLHFIIRQSDAVEEGAIGVPLTWYLTWLDDDLFLWGLLLFIVGSLLAVIRRDRRAMFPLVWFGVSFIIHSLVQRGHTRYLLPLLPPVAILSAWWIVELRRIDLRRLLLFATILTFFANYVVFSCSMPPKQRFSLALKQRRPCSAPWNACTTVTC